MRARPGWGAAGPAFAGALAWAAALAAGSTALAAPAADEDTARDEAVFGAPAEPEGPPGGSGGGDDRDDAIFGGGDRDDAIFGGDAEPPPAADRPATRDDAVLGGGGSAAEGLGQRVLGAYDKLALGGFVFMRLDWYAQTDGDPERFRLASPNLLDVYLDGRPNDRVRAYVRGRVVHDFTVREGTTDLFGGEARRTTVALDQLWIKWDVARRVFFTFGQQALRWGTGRIWNPTDFLNERFRDPLAIFDERFGVSLLKVHVPLEALGWNLYAIADLGDASEARRIGGAVRAEMVFGTAEVSATVAAKRDKPLQLGADFSVGVWLFDLKGELAVLHDLRRPRWVGELDTATLTVPEARDQRDDWLVRAVLGAEIGLRVFEDDTLYLGAEYFCNEPGYDSAELYPWLALQGDFTFLYTGRHYASVYASLPGPGRLDDHNFIASAIGNLSDRSFLTRLDWTARVLTWLSVNVYTTWHYGKEGELRFGIDQPAIPGLLDTPIVIAPPLVEVGAGLRLSI